MAEHFDCVVIGGGPAGAMAAGQAALAGARVLLLDKNRQIGRKLGITGKGRCNVTCDCSPKEFSLEELKNLLELPSLPVRSYLFHSARQHLQNCCSLLPCQNHSFHILNI